MCPPEGDAGTGMVATNSVAVRTGNVSAGTSVFAMIVLEKGTDTYRRYRLCGKEHPHQCRMSGRYPYADGGRLNAA